MFNGKRYNSIDNYYKKTFGCKVYKIALDIGATCPNRDGSKGVGGCAFCSGEGSGDFAMISTQIDEAIKLLKDKAKGKYIAYFQSFSNTYMSVDRLNSYIEQVLFDERIIGIAIATRADCITDDMYEYLTALSKRTHLTVELGLQTVNDKTNEILNRHTSYDEFLATFNRLKELNIKVCVHIINGLPLENVSDMLKTIRVLSALKPHSIKIHMLHVLKNTALEHSYRKGEFTLLSMEDYLDILIKQLRLLNGEVYIERVTGDGNRKTLIEPQWTLSKRYFLNQLNKKMKIMNCVQGDMS